MWRKILVVSVLFLFLDLRSEDESSASRNKVKEIEGKEAEAMKGRGREPAMLSKNILELPEAPKIRKKSRSWNALSDLAAAMRLIKSFSVLQPQAIAVGGELLKHEFIEGDTPAKPVREAIPASKVIEIPKGDRILPEAEILPLTVDELLEERRPHFLGEYGDMAALGYGMISARIDAEFRRLDGYVSLLGCGLRKSSIEFRIRIRINLLRYRKEYVRCRDRLDRIPEIADR